VWKADMEERRLLAACSLLSNSLYNLFCEIILQLQ